MNKDEKMFHQSAGMASPHYKAPRPFDIVKSGAKKVVKKAGKVAKKVLSNLAAPSIEANRQFKMKDEENRRRAESGEYNR